MADGLFVITKAIGGFIAATVSGPLGPVDLPSGSFDGPAAPKAGIVQYADGSVAGRIGRRGEIASSSSLPPLFRKAIVASEDARFYEHAGVDPSGIARAIARRVLGGKVSGASTIAQQTVKNTVVGNDLTVSRKVAEAVLALRLAETMGREEILSLYLDSIYFGRGVHGAAGAARAWFDKDWRDLGVGEMAFIAGVIKAPSRLDPLTNPDMAKERRDYVLARMAETGVISRAVADAEIARPLVTAKPPQPYDLDSWAEAGARRSWPKDLLPARSAAGDATIRSTLSADWQAIVETALRDYLEANFPGHPMAQVELGDGLDEDDWAKAKDAAPLLPASYERAIVTGVRGKSLSISVRAPSGKDVSAKLENFRGDYRIGDVVLVERREHVRTGEEAGANETYLDVTPPSVQGAVVVMDSNSGAILGLAGGYDPRLSQFDRTTAQRQPGSATKPFLWLAALEEGIAYDQMVLDVPISIRSRSETWNPENYGGGSGGAVPLYVALEESSNLVAARLGAEVGVEKFARVAEAAGVWKPGAMRRTPSAVLGTSEVSLIDLTAGFSTIANGGTSVAPHMISQIEGAGTFWTFNSTEGKRIAERKNVRLLQAMLRGVTMRGTARLAFAKHDVPVAGKTGTTQGYRDAWFVGFVPGVTVGVWLGRDDNAPLPQGMTGGASAAFLAARIFGDAKKADLLPDFGQDWPPNLLSMNINADTEEEVMDGGEPARRILEEFADNPPADPDVHSRENPTQPDGYERKPSVDDGYERYRGSRKKRDGNLVFTSPW